MIHVSIIVTMEISRNSERIEKKLNFLVFLPSNSGVVRGLVGGLWAGGPWKLLLDVPSTIPPLEQFRVGPIFATLSCHDSHH